MSLRRTQDDPWDLPFGSSMDENVYGIIEEVKAKEAEIPPVEEEYEFTLPSREYPIFAPSMVRAFDLHDLVEDLEFIAFKLTGKKNWNGDLSSLLQIVIPSLAETLEFNRHLLVGDKQPILGFEQYEDYFLGESFFHGFEKDGETCFRKILDEVVFRINEGLDIWRKAGIHKIPFNQIGSSSYLCNTAVVQKIVPEYDENCLFPITEAQRLLLGLKFDIANLYAICPTETVRNRVLPRFEQYGLPGEFRVMKGLLHARTFDVLASQKDQYINERQAVTNPQRYAPLAIRLYEGLQSLINSMKVDEELTSRLRKTSKNEFNEFAREDPEFYVKLVMTGSEIMSRVIEGMHQGVSIDSLI
jgi:hypothetical protein